MGVTDHTVTDRELSDRIADRHNLTAQFHAWAIR